MIKVDVYPKHWDGEKQDHHKWCKFCKPEKVYAKWSVTILDFGKKQTVACDDHKHLLPTCYYRDDGRMTLADEMSWGRL